MSSLRLFKKRRMSSQDASRTGSGDGDDSSADNTHSPATKRSRAYSITSAYGGNSLPSRSHILNQNHGAQDVQYSSSGVREQTAELSSSFLSDSEMAKHFQDLENRNQDQPRLSVHERVHEPIQEQSEPVTPNETSEHRGSDFPGLLSSSGNGNNLLLYNEDGTQSSPGTGPRRPSNRVPEVVVTDEDEESMGAEERTPLLPRERLPSHRKQQYGSAGELEGQPTERKEIGGIWNRLGHHYPSFHAAKRAAITLSNPKTWNPRQIYQQAIVRPVSTLPAVFLGLLLNLLDALSYGIILFPLGEETFSQMGADGVSMFYVSCIISQLVYSTGSIFRGGVGSEMIEVVPFFHKMTYMIIAKMGTENPDALRATVITSYAMSSILTGIVFFGLGAARLGTLVNFFPHSILVGCIGGVGIFLFLTGLEVSVRLDGNLELTKEVFDKLVAPMSIAQWLPPLVLAILLIVIKKYYKGNFLVPAYYIAITVIFYIITVAVPSLNMENLREAGWVFESPAADKTFYNFYSYYQFGIVDWKAVAMTIPSQFALTFFGILHVPINVPNLAMKVQEDNVSINRELIMHGVSNALSGCVGSIQNYLVYVNSVLFMETGGDSRLAGYMLAAATAVLWVVGPVVIGYVPVVVVGTLIYMLGIDLAKEALWDTHGRLTKLEYFTIVIIAVVMGVYDFVVGIVTGIGLASLVYVVQTSRKSVIRAEFSGAIAESTVRRHVRQRAYLHRVGPQIRVVKIAGYLFFGSIVDVEKRVRANIDAETFAQAPIRYLILDFTHVTGIDFSAAEAFSRMHRVLRRRGVEMVVAGVELHDDVGRSLQMDGLFAEVEGEAPPPEIFETLNGALEDCENQLLITLTEKQSQHQTAGGESPPMQIPIENQTSNNDRKATSQLSQLDHMIGSPRAFARHEAAAKTITENNHHTNNTQKWQNLKQPLPLILQAFQDLTSKSEDFWFRALPFFQPRSFTSGQLLYSKGDAPDGFYILQSGILRADYSLEQGHYHESIVAGTTCGELPFFSNTKRTSAVYAERDSVAWLLTPEKWEELQKKEPEVAQELLKVGLKLSAERMNAITSYVLITAS